MPDYGTISDYLAAHEDSAALLDHVRRVIAEIGPVQERVSKSQVAFGRRRTMAWAWAPGQYLTGKVAPLVLTFDFPSRDASPRWKEIVETGPTRFTHHLELHDRDDLDDEVREWLRVAWEAAG
jgi:hypothetical protein